jgi:hypothetical protein
MKNLNAHEPTNFKKDARCFTLGTPSPLSLDESGVYHMEELFSALPLESTLA